MLMIQAGRPAEAEMHFQRTIDLNPRSSEAHYQLGNMLYGRNAFDDARNQYEEALAIRENYAEAEYGIGWVYRQRDKTDLALAQFAKVVRLQPRYGDAYLSSGDIHAERHQSVEAVADYQKAIQAYEEQIQSLTAAIASAARNQSPMMQAEKRRNERDKARVEALLERARRNKSEIEAAATLAPTGTLRAVFLGTNPVHGRVDAQTGQAIGPVPDLVLELARRLGVPAKIVPAPDAAGVIGALRDHSADIGFLAYDEARAREVDYGAAFLVMFNSYLVPGNSPIKSSADVDRAGVKVAAVKGQTQELFVSSHLKNAQVRVFPTMPAQAELEKLLTSGEVDAFAINRQRSLDAENLSGSRLRALPDSFLEVDQSFVVEKGASAKLEAIRTFVDEVRGSGFIKSSIERAKLTGVDVPKR